MTGINRKAKGMIVTVRMDDKSSFVSKTLKLKIMIKIMVSTLNLRTVIDKYFRR